MSVNEDAVDEDDCEAEFSDDIGIPSYDDSENFERLRFGPLFETDETEPTMGCISLVQGSMGNGQKLDHTIHAFHKDCFMGDADNLCLARLTGGETGGSFRGVIVFVGMSKVESSKVYRHLDTADLTIALKGMTEFSKKQRMGMAYWYQ